MHPEDYTCLYVDPCCDQARDHDNNGQNSNFPLQTMLRAQEIAGNREDVLILTKNKFFDLNCPSVFRPTHRVGEHLR